MGMGICLRWPRRCPELPLGMGGTDPGSRSHLLTGDLIHVIGSLHLASSSQPLTWPRPRPDSPGQS